MRRIHAGLCDSGFYAAAGCSALAVSMLAARMAVFHSVELRFMVWNLFLAWLPWVFSVPMRLLPSRPGHGWKVMPWFLAWLLFLPNAPYMITDVLHVRYSQSAPVWFDASMLFLFAWTGCLLGFHSLRAVHERIENWLGRAAGWGFVVGAALLTGFGIYLGRFLRWNSWDVVARPKRLAWDVLSRVVNPTDHPKTWGVTLLFAAFMLVAYATMIAPRRGFSRR